MMVLIALVAVGLLGLASITVSSSSRATAQGEARANARMAMMMALGQLQEALGPDQRVSANASILASADSGDGAVPNPHWTGVWSSWKAGQSDTSAVDGISYHATIDGRGIGGMKPTYDKHREDHFHSWLLSLTPGELEDLASAENIDLDGLLLPEEDTEAALLVGEGSLGDNSDPLDFVSARLIETDTGSYAWWVGDESQKARVMDDRFETDPKAPTLAERLFRQQAAGSTGTKAVDGLEGVTAEGEVQLGSLPSLQTMDLVDGAAGAPSEGFHSVTPYSYSVLADVREGGLKRDLSTLLERPIADDRSGMPRETGDDFMLYKFNTKDQWMGGPDNQECVPIHDLAAYYQLYDSYRDGWNEGLLYSSNLMSDGYQVVSTDFGEKNPEGQKKYLKAYTNLYRQPVPIKVQFLLSLFAEEINPKPKPTRANPNPDSHLLRIGITPAITLWNPTNVPLVMRCASDPNLYAQMTRMGNLPIRIKFRKNGDPWSKPQNMSWLACGDGGGKAHIFNMYFSGKRPIRFEPGEVKTFSLPFSGDVSGMKKNGDGHINMFKDEFLFKTDKYYEGHEAAPGWDPESFMFFNRSAAPDTGVSVIDSKLPFSSGDRISFEITGDNSQLPNGDGSKGAAFFFHFIQTNHQSYAGGGTWWRRNYQFNSRNGGGGQQVGFNETLIGKGFPRGSATITAASRSGSNIIARSDRKEGWPFMQFSLMAGTETSEGSNGGVAGGRKFASRPFLHSSALSAPFIDDHSGNALYNVGWNWWVEEINDVFEAPVQVSVDDQGYYGGGYTPESGVTNVVQQEVPLVPPISIAALSHAHLGGFSIARDEVGGKHLNQNVTATGQAGLFPHTLQAIGNSYAHPLIPADRAFVSDFQRTFNADNGASRVTLADHSYLANKALWDDYFFSSITPESASAKVFQTRANKPAERIASEFFFGEEPLPNRRMVPYIGGLSPNGLTDLFRTDEQWRGGLADRIAAHLIVEGAFNVNSTSVDAWKVFLSSLRGKPVAYLDKEGSMNGGTELEETSTSDGTPVNGFNVPAGRPIDRSPNDPSEPDQWLGARELSDQEIEELAEAMVRQVRERGPFLSLSEFVNRRLDSRNGELSAKGALQAALDDPKVSINQGFRNQKRELETGGMTPAFREALEGPVAYGSAAYVDQADVLRHLGAQLTPRGDTFVIRTYGDSRDPSGKVQARAWCEAVVQRLPEYLDAEDQPETEQAELAVEANRQFGRKFELVSFRWLTPSEI
ncbi:hypothetical protein HAHE_02130 [Haloferula helveola]|uniref:Verru_Chthon cassette protein A n=1 Tax=Haloferula helveola TaxID=490095 RepID=A0ABN6GYE3_9BACT|nr:hypothetical protein HAHE_02130 [Haloferula helveola]